MLTYNKDKSLYGDIGIEENEALMTDLINNIKEKGFNGFKGYFYAIYKKTKTATEMKESKGNSFGGAKNTPKQKNDGRLELLINTSYMLPVEEW